MAGEQQFTIGAKASCTDGHCGEVRRIVFDPATGTVTHLVIQPGHQKAAGRLVPVHLAEITNGEIRLRCTRAEFSQLDYAADMFADTVQTERPMGVGMSIAPGPGLLRHATIVEDALPAGEDELRPGDRVHALDGEIGRVRGFIVNPGDDRATHVLLREGHLWGSKVVAIPISAVTGLNDGVRLNSPKSR
jgi:sporulation protein YlmC with PRC-barrel domain